MAIIPNTDVNLAANIRDVLNADGGSVTNDVTTFFTSAAKINKWAKFKPVVSPTLFHTLAQWQSSGYKGGDGKCGLTIPTFASVSSFRTAVSNGTSFWSYTPPQGGTTQPMRLGDFRGYDTDAMNPIGDVATNGLIIDGEVQFDIDVIISSSTTNLTLTDLSINSVPLSEHYLGIYAYNDSGNFYFYTGTTPIGNAEGLSVKIPITITGKWYYVPFLASKAQTESGVPATFIGLNYAPKMISITSSSALYTASVYAYWNQAKNSVTIDSVDIYNNSSGRVTITSITAHIYRASSNAADGSAGTLLASVPITTNVTIEGNSYETVYVNKSTSVSFNSNYSYWVGASTNLNNSITTWSGIEEDTSEDG